MKLHPEFIVNERGEKTAVVLPIRDYERLLESIEDQMDAADLDEAIKHSEELIPYEQVREQLRSEGKL